MLITAVNFISFSQVLTLNFVVAGNAGMVEKLATTAEAHGKYNIAFTSFFMLGKLQKCLEILVNSDRIPEAAFFARYFIYRKFSTPLNSLMLISLLRFCCFPELIYRAKFPKWYHYGETLSVNSMKKRLKVLLIRCNMRIYFPTIATP